MKVGGGVLFTTNRTINSGLFLRTTKRSGITDMMAFADSQKADQVNRLDDVKQSEISQLVINGLPAWRFEVTGKGKTSKLTITYLLTVFEGDEEIVIVNTWTAATGFAQQKESLLKIVDSLTGLSPPRNLAKEEEDKKKAAEEEARQQEEAKRQEEVKRQEEAKRQEETRLQEEARQQEDARQQEEVKRKASKDGSKKSSGVQLRTAGSIDFNAEARKSALILGCSASDLKVTGLDGKKIVFFVTCNGGASMMLACDPTGRCLKK